MNSDKFKPGRIFNEMCEIYQDNKTPDNKITICNEGSSRSKKTFDAFHFIYLFCEHNRNKNNMIYILRNILKDCREKTFDDFKSCMTIIGHSQKYLSEGMAPEVNLFGNKLRFRGLDHESKEGYPSDIVFYNESLEMDQERIAGISMRCRKLEIYDWNPKYTQHWCFNLEGQPDTFFTHSTYKDNTHLQQSVIDSIEKLCPWHFDDMHLDEKERRPHPTNIANQTANKHRWLVYGEGKRSSPEGLIFQYANYIDEWPDDVAYVYGLDYGFVNDRSALVKVGETQTDIYLELLLYDPTATAAILDGALTALGIERNIQITADSSDKYTAQNKGTVEMTKELKEFGWLVRPVSKTKNIIYWINKMKEKRLSIINNNLVHHARRSQENYSYKVIAGGITIEQPDSDKRVTINGETYKFNDFFDGSRYGYMSLNQPSNVPFVW